jgi:predicted DNA-binding transcriptional regulator YafY
MPRNAEVIRQWNVLREIEASSVGLPIDVLARLTGVTTRTIRRDLEALQEAGFTLYDDRVEGRTVWKLDARPFKRLSDTGFTISELCALYFSRTLLECLVGTPFRHDLEQAFAKLETSIAPRMRRFLDRLPAVLTAKAEPARTRSGDADRRTIARLIQATLDQRRASIRYHSASSGRTKEYLVEPYRLVYGHGSLYLLAHVPEYRQLRTFAVDRIEQLSLLEETFEPIDGLSDEAFAHSLGIHEGPPERVEIEFDARVAPYVRERLWHASQAVVERPDGGLTLTLDVCLDATLRGWILGFGPLARVLSPAPLAAEIAADHQRAWQRYQSSPNLEPEPRTRT